MTDQATINDRLARGEIVQVGNKLVIRCRECGKLVTLNKPIVGGLHVCA